MQYDTHLWCRALAAPSQPLDHKRKQPILLCWELPREIPPMTKVMWRRPDRQRWIRTQGIPWTCSSIYPKTKLCLLLIILCLSPTLLTLTGGYPRPPFSVKSQLRAIINKSPWHKRSISIQTPLLTF